MPKGIKGFQPRNKCGKQFQKGIWLDLSCVNCNVTFSAAQFDINRGRKYCSRRCHLEKLGKDRSGKDHWNWQGGISNKWDILHNSKEYKQWRMSVFKRDKFKCQECSIGRSRKNPLHAHHIKPKSEYPNLILDVNNGLTLCKNCHVNLHRRRH